jgi:hypothetical protein
MSILLVTQLIKKITCFMEPEGPLDYRQEPDIGSSLARLI